MMRSLRKCHGNEYTAFLLYTYLGMYIVHRYIAKRPLQKTLGLSIHILILWVYFFYFPTTFKFQKYVNICIIYKNLMNYVPIRTLLQC